MDSQRIIDIIVSDLTLENLKIQENLEIFVNSSDEINTKIFKIKEALKALAINELMFTKFKILISKLNNIDQNQNQNG